MAVDGVRDVLGHGASDSSQVAHAFCALGFLDAGLNGRQGERCQHSDDGDHHQQFYESEGLETAILK